MGSVVHSWLVRDGYILSPERLAGRPLLKGFTRWSSEKFAGDVLEAATLLSRTCFIATVRPYAPEASAGAPIQLNVVAAAPVMPMRRSGWQTRPTPRKSVKSLRSGTDALLAKLR